MIEIYLLSSFFMLLVLCILFFRSTRELGDDPKAKINVAVVVVIACYVLCDALFAASFMGATQIQAAFPVVVAVFYFLYSLTPLAWYAFVKNCFFDDGMRRLKPAETIPFALLAIMVVVSIPTGILWSFDDAGQYQRGALFESFTTINLFYYVASAILTLYVVIKEHGERYYVIMLFFSCVPLAGMLVNTYVVPVSVTYPFQPFCLVIGLLFAYMFVIERKREDVVRAYQESLSRAVEEAQRANASKTDFLRRMSHDIRTPINGIRGMVEIANHYSDDLGKQQECRAKIWESTDLLLSLVNDILDMSKLESGKVEPVYEPFDLRRLLREVHNIVESQAVENGIEYRDECDKSHLEHVRLVGCDVYLKRVLINFASNAVKYNREGGFVSMCCKELSCDGKRATYVFGCEDNGIGMSEEFAARAFEPFEQEHDSARTHCEGSGLGLAIAKQLIELMGGEVDLQSRQGEGTTIAFTVSFELDLRVESGAGQPVFDESEVDMSGVRALLAEDNELNAEIAIFMLGRHGVDVRWVTDGAQAVDAFANSAQGSVDVVFMDVMMPVMSGLEAAQAIRQLDRADAKSVPIFALTANAFADDVARSLDAGMNEHLSKPLSESEIIAALQKWVIK